MPYRPPNENKPAPLGPLTGYDVAKASGARVVIAQPGEDSCFAWRHGVIVLAPDVAKGTDMHSLLIAAEEAAHFEQPRWLHALRFLHPIRWYQEQDAFTRVKAWLRGWKK